MAMERDDDMALMCRRVDDYRGEVGHLRNRLRELTEDIQELRNGRARGPPEVIDLTGDDDEGIVVGENKVPLMVRIEREETVVPGTPQSPTATLVEIGEPVVDGRSTPQIMGEAERVFKRMEREGSVEQRAWDEEADYVHRHGVAPEYDDAPPYEYIDFLS